MFVNTNSSFEICPSGSRISTITLRDLPGLATKVAVLALILCVSFANTGGLLTMNPIARARSSKDALRKDRWLIIHLLKWLFRHERWHPVWFRCAKLASI